MTNITLIRHGQASFGAKNYDLLSELGKRQAHAVGRYFKNHHIQFERIIHGDMVRQLDTAKIIATSSEHKSKMLLNSAVNEFDSDNLLKHYLPILASSSSDYNKIINGSQSWFSCNQNFELIFSALVRLWQQDQQCPFESWIEFRGRVLSFLIELEALGNHAQRIAVVTSGGLIAIVIQALWELKETSFIDINLTINNASLTEIKLAKAKPVTDAQLIKASENQQRTSKLNARLLSFNNISPLQMTNNKKFITRK